MTMMMMMMMTMMMTRISSDHLWMRTGIRSVGNSPKSSYGVARCLVRGIKGDGPRCQYSLCWKCFDFAACARVRRASTATGIAH
eukprot:3055428-Rhodomonas_salina.2